MNGAYESCNIWGAPLCEDKPTRLCRGVVMILDKYQLANVDHMVNSSKNRLVQQ